MNLVAAVGPVLLGLAIGWALRRGGVGASEHGRFLLQLNFYVCLPALVLPAVAEAEIDRTLVVFPFAAVVMVGAGWLVGRAVGARAALDARERAVVTTSYMVVNCAFALPFVGAVYGPAGVLRVAAFDLVHGVLVATLVLAVAARANPDAPGRKGEVLRQVLRTPLVHALAVGAVVNAADWSLPDAVTLSLRPFAMASLAVVALGCGLVVGPVGDMRPVSALSLGRLALGLLVAGGLVLALDLGGTDRGVLLMLGATPLGFVVVTFSAVHGLGTRLSSSMLLVSLALSIAVYSGVGLLA